MINTSIDTQRKYVKMKKDVYEHLAKTFLEKKVKKNNNKRPIIIAISAISFVLLTILILLVFVRERANFSKSLLIVQYREPIEIGYDFSSNGGSKIQAISYDLKGLDLQEYNQLRLSVRTKEKENIASSLKVKIGNLLLEKDAEYISGVSAKWKTYTISLKEFENIKDWSSVAELSFIVEEWNVEKKINKIYIDDVKFVSIKEKK